MQRPCHPPLGIRGCRGRPAIRGRSFPPGARMAARRGRRPSLRCPTNGQP